MYLPVSSPLVAALAALLPLSFCIMSCLGGGGWAHVRPLKTRQPSAKSRLNYWRNWEMINERILITQHSVCFYFCSLGKLSWMNRSCTAFPFLQMLVENMIINKLFLTMRAARPQLWACFLLAHPLRVTFPWAVLIQTVVTMLGHPAGPRSPKSQTQRVNRGAGISLSIQQPKPSSSQSVWRFGFGLDGGWSPARVSATGRDWQPGETLLVRSPTEPVETVYTSCGSAGALCPQVISVWAFNSIENWTQGAPGS